MNSRVVSLAWVMWGLLVTFTVLYGGKAFGSSVGISIPQCNNLSVVSAVGSSITLNCTGSVPPTPPSPGPPPPNPPGIISCTGFSNTVVLNANWVAPVRMFATMGINTAIVVVFTTGSVSTTSSLPRVAGAEYNSSPSTRIARLSSTPCDFTTQPVPGANIEGNSVTATFAILPGSGFNYYPRLSTNTTYYVNVKNATSPTCEGSGVCDMFFDLIKPGGL